MESGKEERVEGARRARPAGSTEGGRARPARSTGVEAGDAGDDRSSNRPRVLWGRVVILVVVLATAFFLGRVSAQAEPLSAPTHLQGQRAVTMSPAPAHDPAGREAPTLSQPGLH
ncbi:hypothetical protein BH18ACT15_BH18ACT15_09900 [soil metagenome]